MDIEDGVKFVGCLDGELLSLDQSMTIIDWAQSGYLELTIIVLPRLYVMSTRELEVDVNEGLNASMSLHHRLQIGFRYPQLMQAMAQCSKPEPTIADASIM